MFSFLWFFSSTPCFFLFFLSRDIAQVVTGHPHTHLFCFFLFFLCCPAALDCSAHFGRASCFLAFSSGCHLLFFWRPAWVSFLLDPSWRLLAGRRTSATRSGGSSTHVFMFFLLSLPGSVASPCLPPPSVLSLSLSLSMHGSEHLEWAPPCTDHSEPG